MDDFEIKKNIPKPYRKNTAAKFPLDSMEVGDMFEVPVAMRHALAGAVQRAHKQTNMRFTIRTINSTTRGVWRER